MAGRVYLCAIAVLVMATAHVSATFLPLMPHMMAPLVHPVVLNPFLGGPFMGRMKMFKGKVNLTPPRAKPLSRPFTLADLPGGGAGPQFPIGGGNSRDGFFGGNLGGFRDNGNFGRDVGGGGLGAGLGGGFDNNLGLVGGGLVGGDVMGGGFVGGTTNDIIGSASALGDVVGTIDGGGIIPAANLGGIGLAAASNDLNSLSLNGAVDPMDINGGYGYVDVPRMAGEFSDSSVLVKSNAPLNADISDSTVIVRNSAFEQISKMYRKRFSRR